MTRLSTLARRLRRELLKRPGITPLPVCQACGKQVQPARLRTDGICTYCWEDYADWCEEQRQREPTDAPDYGQMKWLPEEDDQ